MGMLRSKGSEDFAKLLIRLSTGGLLLCHGINKLMNGYGFVGDMLADVGLPAILQHGVIIGEVLAPLLMIVGYWSRPAAFIVVINMITSIYLVFRHDLFSLNKTGGWAIELNVLYLVGALAIVLMGAGKFSMSGGKGRWD